MSEEEREELNILFHLAHINTYLDLDIKSIHKISTDIIEKWKNASGVILNLIQKQQEIIEKKDKIIDLMVDYIKDPYQLIIWGNTTSKSNAIKQYFEKKVEEKNENT